MKLILIFILYLLPVISWAQNLQNLFEYTPGSFISTLVDINTGEVFFAPTEGAKLINGIIPPSLIVRNYGGHGAIARTNNVADVLEERGIYAGGILIQEDAFVVKFKSASVNGKHTNPNLFPHVNFNVPHIYRNRFVHLLANYFNVGLEYEGRIFRPGTERSVCAEMFFIGL
jgi:hypothetical protein